MYFVGKKKGIADTKSCLDIPICLEFFFLKCIKSCVSFSVICFAYNGQIWNLWLFVIEPYGGPLNLIGAPQSAESKITLTWTPNIMDAPESKNLKVQYLEMEKPWFVVAC